MHLVSQHAPGFPAAAVAAIGQVSWQGGSWGQLSSFRKANCVLFCPLASLWGTGSTREGVKQTEALKQLYRARMGVTSEEKKPDINSGVLGPILTQRA